MKAECVVMPRLPPALHDRDFRRLWLGMLGSSFGTQMVSVAVGWQVYAIHRSAFDLGLIGLAEFLPLAVLALPAGQLADRLPRTLIAAGSAFAEAVVVALLLVVTLEGAAQLWAYVALAALTGAASAIGSPAGRALTPEIVPTDLLGGALALRSIAGQAANVSGPALGGLLFSLQPEAVYAVGSVLLVVVGPLHADRDTPGRERARRLPRSAAVREPVAGRPVHPLVADHPGRDHP